MKKFLSGSIIFGLIMILGYGTVFAQNDNNGFPTGRHYNLNIICVPMDKEVPSMTDSNRHTIFVPCNEDGEVDRNVKIYYEINTDDPNNFRVIDGNATDEDEAATIQVPYEYCDLTQVNGCYEMLNFEVYARALGKPGDGIGAIVTASCEYDGETALVDDEDCTDTLDLGGFEVSRPKGKVGKAQDITGIFRASGCVDKDESLDCNSGDIRFQNIWIFNLPFLESYFWDYDNNGLKLLQVRFYEKAFGSIEIVP